MSRLLAAFAGMASGVGDEGLATFSTDQQKRGENAPKKSHVSAVAQSVAQIKEAAFLSRLSVLFSKFPDVAPQRIESIILESLSILAEAAGIASERTLPTNWLPSRLSNSNPD